MALRPAARLVSRPLGLVVVRARPLLRGAMVPMKRLAPTKKMAPGTAGLLAVLRQAIRLGMGPLLALLRLLGTAPTILSAALEE